MDDSAPNIDPLHTSAEYQRSFRALTACVRGRIMQRADDPSIFNLHDTIIKHGEFRLERKKLIGLFVRDAEDLLNGIAKNRAVVEESSIFSTPEASDELLERLTGDWLALYFLGFPFVHLWEAVAFFAEGSGFPRGATLCTAVGGVYRSARKSYVAGSHGGLLDEEIQPVYVLDHNPMVMRKIMDTMEKSDASAGNGGKPLSLSIYIAFLGMLYERLQLALYLHSGGPMRFCVPAGSLKRTLQGRASSSAAEAEQELDLNIAFMWAELKHCFRDEFSQKQSIRIVDDEELNYLPGCVLRPTQGIFRTRENPKKLSLGRAGNYLATRVRKEFLEKLQGIPTTEESLQVGSFDSFKGKCQCLLSSASLRT